ncbi:MAG: FAD-dependent monooxygenase [Actinobacteria bacterium]|nr:FAD-dependent monooxygenase [Actinomycetota bacterium]
MGRRLHVLIAGGGLGGLCLAQGLRRFGHSCVVFERDSDLDRKVGYRLHMNADGGEALRACLPPDLFELYLETSRKTPPRQHAVVIDDQLNELSSMPHIGPPNQGPRPHTAVDRRTLRQILLGRLGDAVHLGAAVVGYEEIGDRVRVLLVDGSTEEGDLLVGADGIRSAVRAQRLPETVIIDAAIQGLGLYARSSLPADLQAEIPPVLMDGFVIATDRRDGLLAMGAYNPRRPVTEARAAIAPDIPIDPVDDYMMVGGNPAEGTAIPPFAEWTDATATELRDSMLDAHSGWHPALRGVVERIDPATMFSISFGRLDPTSAWVPSRVTLLGDAIHAMLPTLGQGANMALRDAATLARALAETNDPVAAIAAYEAAMRDYVYPLMEAAADPSSFGGGGLARPAAD